MIPLGEKQDAAFKGALTAIALTSAFGALTWIASKMFRDTNALKQGTLAMVATAGIILVLSESVSHFVKLGEQLANVGPELIIGAGSLMLLMTGTMFSIAYLIGELLDNKKLQMNMLTGGLVLTGIGVIISILSNSVGEFVNLANAMKEVSAEDLLSAGTTTVLLLGVFGGIMAGIGALISSGAGAVIIASGALGMIAIAGVIDITSMIVKDYVKRAVEIAEYDKDKVLTGSEIITEVMGSFGVIMGMTGLFGPLLAVGGLVMIEMGAVMENTIKVMQEYSSGVLAILAMNRTNKWETGDLYSGTQIMKGMFDSFYTLMDSLGFGVLKQAVYLAVYRTAMDATLDVVKKYADILLYAKKNMSVDDVTNFYNMMIGKDGLNDTSSMLGTINTLVNGLMEVGDSIDTGLFFILGMKSAQKVLDVISKFIDVVAKAATLTYVIGYDSNGNPMYGKIKPEDFNTAADVVTGQFKTFITRMSDGMEDVSIVSMFLCSYMDTTMIPVINAIGKFVDVIQKAATMQYVSGYDRNGKPVYMKLTSAEFKNSADVVVESFITFVDQLTTRTKDLKLRTLVAIEWLGESMDPIMGSVSDFVDSVLKAATGNYVTGYDDKGKAIYQHVTAAMFGAAATQIVNNFIIFIDGLEKEVRGMKSKTTRTIETLGEGLGPIMDGVSGFVDGIMKAATGTYILSYDENGKPKEIVKVTDKDFNDAAEKVVTQFGKFIDALLIHTQNLKKRKAEVIGTFGESIGEVMDTVSQFTDAIMKVATGSYIKGYDENGKALYEHVDNAMIDQAADTIITYYVKFIDKMLEYASNPKLKKNALKYMEEIGESIEPIMDSVIDFADMLTMLMKPNGTIKVNGKEVPFYLDLDKIGSASEKIADAYTIFINTLITKLDTTSDFAKNAEKAAGYMKYANQVVEHSASGAKTLSELIKTLEQIKGLSDIASGKPGNVAINFVNALTHFAGSFVAADVNFELAHQKMIQARNFLNVSKEASLLFKEIIDALSGTGRQQGYSMYINNYNEAINKLAGASFESNFDNNNLIPFLSQTVTAANQLRELEHIMGTGDITKAVNRFINDISVLTSKEVTGKLETSNASIGLFTVELHKMTTTISTTNTEVNQFAASIERASTALQNFDKAMLESEKRRNEALKEFGAIVKDIANSMEQLTDKIEALDENKILSNFKGIVELLRVADAGPETGIKKTGNAPQTAQPVVAPQKIFDNSIIEFRFDNVQFTGIANQY